MPGFTEADLRRLAGPASFERGLGYVDQVTDLDITAAEVTATVSGTDDYEVILAPGQRGLGWDCSCPFGQEGAFCKHCVAVGLVVLGPDAGEQARATRARRDSVDAWLESLSREDLAAELRGLLDGDHGLRRRFELRAAAASGDTLAIRRTTRELITPRRGGYVADDEADAYADGVYEVAAVIDGLAKAGAGEQAIQAAREAIGELGRAFDRLDDSNGAVRGAAAELLAAHLRACQAAPPEPASLAHYLARLALHDPFGIAPDLSDYAGLLGAAGLGRLREQVTGARREHRDPRRPAAAGVAAAGRGQRGRPGRPARRRPGRLRVGPPGHRRRARPGRARGRGAGLGGARPARGPAPGRAAGRVPGRPVRGGGPGRRRGRPAARPVRGRRHAGGLPAAAPGGHGRRAVAGRARAGARRPDREGRACRRPAPGWGWTGPDRSWSTRCWTTATPARRGRRPRRCPTPPRPPSGCGSPTWSPRPGRPTPWRCTGS